MNAAKHTAGPWEIHPSYTRVAYVVPATHVSRAVGGHTDAALDLSIYAQEICSLDCPDRHRSKEEMRANARLVASAPELLDALLAILETSTYDDYPNTPEHKALERGRVVVAKATGAAS